MNNQDTTVLGPDGKVLRVAIVAELLVKMGGAERVVKKLAEMMIEHAIHRIVITNRGRITGILSTLDLLYFIAEKERNG